MAAGAAVALANHAHVFPPAIKADGTIDVLLRYLDACDIARAVCFAPFPFQVKEPGFDPNDWLAREVVKHDRLYAFGTLDFARSDMRDQVFRMVDRGFKGIKIHPPG